MTALTIAQAAARLAVSRATVYRLIAAGRLPVCRLSSRIVRIPAEAISELLWPSAPTPTPKADVGTPSSLSSAATASTDGSRPAVPKRKPRSGKRASAAKSSTPTRSGAARRFY